MNNSTYFPEDPDRPKVPSDERIECAAVRWFNDIGGECIVWGTRRDLSNAHHLIRDDLIARNPVHGNTLFENAEQGFLTTTGRFVSRREAFPIAHEANQIIHKQPTYHMLYSEDLRPCVAKDHAYCFVHRESL